MTTTLLQTKLYVPSRRTNLIGRFQLIHKLEAGLNSRLILVSAPAGFGKTTLVSNLVHELEWPTAWLSLDENDNDPVRFLAYLLAALQKAGANLGQETQMLLGSQPLPTVETLLTPLMNDLEQLSQRVLLVLDDYHLIKTEMIHDCLAFLLHNLPQTVQLLLASRMDPPLPLARLRVRRQMVEVREADLRFSAEETAEFINQIMGLGLSSEAIQTLADRTEGWIAGLQLAALSLQGRDDAHTFVHNLSGDHRYIVDYLVEEVLERQDEETQAFLLQTAVLERINGSLSEAVTGLPGGQARLEQLDRANLFLVSLDDTRHWYRYHHLFGAFLLNRLQHRLPEKIPQLHRRASDWLAANQLEIAAVEHALAGEDPLRAAYLIEQIGRRIMSGELPIPTVLGWLDKLPEELVLSRPRLCLIHAWWLVWSAQFEAAEKRLLAAEAANVDNEAAIVGEVAAVRANIHYATAQIPPTIQYAQTSLAILPNEEWLLQRMMTLMLGHAYRLDGDPAAARRAYRQTIDVPAAVRFMPGAIISLGHLVQLDVAEGRLSQAAMTHERTMNFVREQQHEAFPATGIAYVEMGKVLRERNELKEAAALLERGIDLCRHWQALLESHVDAYICLARVKAAGRDVVGAKGDLVTAVHLAQAHNLPQWVVQAQAAQAHLWLAQGEMISVATWLTERKLTPHDDIVYLHEAAYLVLARWLISQGELEAAINLLARLYDAAQAKGRWGSAYQIQIVQSMAWLAKPDETEALTLLAPVLAAAEREGYCRLFVDEGQRMVTLLQLAASRGVYGGTAVKLLNAFSPTTPTVLPNQHLVDPLSPREIEVLACIAAGKSNKEIAAVLVVSMSTVKKHINHIYNKLNVTSRTQAIVRANELKLLP